MIEARGLSRSFGGRLVLENVDLTVREGEVVGFLGPNGAGKTTTMRCLLGLLRPDAGTASVTRPVGYVPERSALYDQLTVRSHLRFLASVSGAPVDDIERVATATDVDSLLRRPIGRLSRGQRQRVALAAALLGSPSSLVLDEPTQGLDPAQVVAVRELLVATARDGAAVLLSTHLLAEASTVCDRVVILVAGRVVDVVDRNDGGFAGLEARFLRLVAEASVA